MLTIKDVHDEVHKEVEAAVAQISLSINKVLESMVTKDEFEKRMGSVEARIENLEVRLSKIEKSVEDLKTEVMYVKTELRDLKNDTPSIATIRDLEKRVAFLENAVVAS